MKSELQAIDRKARKLFTIYGALHHKLDVDRLYTPRKEVGRGLISIEDCVELAIRGLKRSKKEKRLEDWEEKGVYMVSI